ncbi:MAG: enoyl-CoA hydratase-related protein [Acidimicrobiales bacterium]|jgi:enoyl-CoA hydratase|nr:enoyl-CoA hydratase-related protein [Acidimicrobiales bacterium]
MPGIRTERDGAIGTLIIDNPTRRNAMTADMYTAVPAAAAELVADPDIRVIILRGAGDEAFGAGSDISEFPTRRLGDQAEAYDNAEHGAWEALAAIPLPVLAAIHGPCMGGGIAMALHCDVRIAAEGATFSVPPARLGLAYPQDALGRLIELVGPAQAKLLLYSARVFGTDEALSMGLVQAVTPMAELDAYVEKLAMQISRLAPITHRATKLSVDAFADEGLAASAASARRDCYASADFREGVQAFLDKRHATFEGH